ncbi:L-xylulose reductase [Araneus ventricosus]|uniref:L-xylulose reductase n=1 Tax=Araneus ventricosus TaxID=182803 RepID=A0A4Y2E3E8_ARAVE|nr:L-xylulose reductase [Araneus ventricosus]
MNDVPRFFRLEWVGKKPALGQMEWSTDELLALSRPFTSLSKWNFRNTGRKKQSLVLKTDGNWHSGMANLEFQRIQNPTLHAPIPIWGLDAKIVAEGMKERGNGGSIVNVSSQAALVALPLHATYCASKGALDQLTKVMALELGPFQIRVNSVNPTVVLTDMGIKAWGEENKAKATKAKIPLGKFCDPDDVVKAVIFLLSDDARMITGVQLPIDGGYTIH